MAVDPRQTEGMTAAQLAAALMSVAPNAQILARVDGKWLAVYGITHTGAHRNAYMLDTVSPATGVTVVESEDLDGFG